MKLNLCLLLPCLGALLASSGCVSAFTYTAEPMTAVVIDADTKKPLEGVVVVAHWQLITGTAGGSVEAGQLMVMEAVTGPDGKFTFPGFGPKTVWNRVLVNQDPELLLFRPGYEYRRFFNPYSSDWALRTRPVRRSVWDGKTIELKRYRGTGEGYAEHIYKLDGNLDRMRDGDQCEWKSIPRMLVALHRMRERFDAEGVKVPGWQIGARIRKVTDVGNQKRCGSAEEFFRSYLP